MADPIPSAEDVEAAAWIAARLDRSRGGLTSLIPAGFEAYARIRHGPRLPGLPHEQVVAVVDLLRGETTTPDRCWFCVAERARDVAERVRMPSGAAYLLHGGPIEQTLGSAPADDAQPDPSLVSFSSDAADAGLDPWPVVRRDRPELWWPEDRAWFVCTVQFLDSTFVAGSRALIDRLLALPGPEVLEARATDRLADLEDDEAERAYGPVIASGTEASRPWSFRGRIGSDGVATQLQTSTGGGAGMGGALPFADLGWKQFGHFGCVGWGEGSSLTGPRTRRLDGVVSKQTTAVDIQLSDGTRRPATLVDTGDPRASFFVAVWSTPTDWDSLVARDATGAELETLHRS